MTVFVFDEFDPETTAMLQALYSRSAASVSDHIEKVKRTGSSKFMENYYIGYGHASIGDCGTTTLFIEDVSILATKVIQDNPLYSGQESSTRYLDFSKQGIVDPINTELSKRVLRNWIEFYLAETPKVVSALKERFPRQSKERHDIWNKAIKARCFDILRGFLPAGIRTQLSWTTNLRQAAEHIDRFCTHPLEEVRQVGAEMKTVLSEKYPSSFSHKQDEEKLGYLENYQSEYAFLKPKNVSEDFNAESVLSSSIPRELIGAVCERPPKTTLPRNLANLARFRINGLLDYGSFRDLQRHRNAYCPIPLLTKELGFNQWYLEQLPYDVQCRALRLLDEQERRLDKLAALGTSSKILQYYIPMGYSVYMEIEYDLSEILYVAELRSGRTVHPTLRCFAVKLCEVVESKLPSVPVYADKSTDDFDIRRGLQDIVEKSV